MAGTETKRIIELTEASTVQSGDFIAVDSNARGTKKVPTSALATSAALTAETNARTGADEQMSERMDGIEEQTALIQNPTKTLSGALVSFSDGAEMPMVACTAEIVPKQSGTGTPSPENVRPISGWESVSVNVSGKNLCNPQDTIDRGGVLQDDGSIYVANQNSIYDKTAFENEKLITGQFAITFKVKYSDATRVGSYPRVEYTDGTKTALFSVTVSGDWVTYTGVTNASKTVKRLFWYYSSNVPTYYYLQVEQGNTPTAYEPFGTTTTVNLGRTVCGGTLDVVSGVLTAYPFYPSYNGETLDGRWICDRAVYAQGTTPPIGSQVALTSGESTTYQLTPTEIQTLLGENNVWADSGEVEITYRRDISIVLENLENAING